MGKLVTDLIFQNLSWRNYFKGGLYDGIQTNNILGISEFQFIDPIFKFRTGKYKMKKIGGYWGLWCGKEFTGLYKLGNDQESPVGKWNDGEVIDFPDY